MPGLGLSLHKSINGTLGTGHSCKAAAIQPVALELPASHAVSKLTGLQTFVLTTLAEINTCLADQMYMLVSQQPNAECAGRSITASSSSTMPAKHAQQQLAAV